MHLPSPLFLLLDMIHPGSTSLNKSPRTRAAPLLKDKPLSHPQDGSPRVRGYRDDTADGLREWLPLSTFDSISIAASTPAS